MFLEKSRLDVSPARFSTSRNADSPNLFQKGKIPNLSRPARLSTPQFLNRFLQVCQIAPNGVPLLELLRSLQQLNR